MEGSIQLKEIVDVEYQIRYLIKDFSAGFSVDSNNYDAAMKTLNLKINEQKDDVAKLNNLIDQAKSNIATNESKIIDLERAVNRLKFRLNDIINEISRLEPTTVYTRDEDGNTVIDAEATASNEARVRSLEAEAEKVNEEIIECELEIDKRTDYIYQLEKMIDEMETTIVEIEKYIDLLNEDVTKLNDQFVTFKTIYFRCVEKTKNAQYASREAERYISYFGASMNQIYYEYNIRGLRVYFTDVSVFKVSSSALQIEVANLKGYEKNQLVLIKQLSKASQYYLNMMNSADDVTLKAVGGVKRSVNELEEIKDYYKKYINILSEAASTLANYERIRA